MQREAALTTREEPVRLILKISELSYNQYEIGCVKESGVRVLVDLVR